MTDGSRPVRFLTRFLDPLYLLTALLCFVCSLVPVKSWIQETVTCLSIYWISLLLLLTPRFTMRVIRSRVSSGYAYFVGFMATAAIVVHLYWIYPFYTARLIPTESSKHYKLVYANLLVGSGSEKELIRPLAEIDPDLVFLTEYEKEAGATLQLGTRYPYSKEVVGHGAFGLAIFSKHPFSGEVITDFGTGTTPAIVADLILDKDRIIKVGLVHAAQPLSPIGYKLQGLLLRRIATIFKHLETPGLVVGDLNATFTSPNYRIFTNLIKMDDAEWGFGLRRTWNAFSPFFRLDLDHIFVSKDVATVQYRILDPIGSDHFPIMAELAFN